jgi:hypothetical protein
LFENKKTIEELIDMLVLFMLQITKKDVTMYLLTMVLFCFILLFCLLMFFSLFLLLYGNIQFVIAGIHMLIMQRQNQWVVETNVALEDGFNIFTDARYNWAKHASGEVTM